MFFWLLHQLSEMLLWENLLSKAMLKDTQQKSPNVLCNPHISVYLGEITSGSLLRLCGDKNLFLNFGKPRILGLALPFHFITF